MWKGIMCRAKSDPNYYRCEWGYLTSSKFFDKLNRAAADVSVELLPVNFSPATDYDWDEIADHARSSIIEGILDELPPKSEAKRRRKAAAGFGCGESHILCAVAAAIGEASATITGIPTDLAATVAKEVRRSTGSTIAAKLARAATRKLLENVSSKVDPLSQLGFLADFAAVGFCPSQQEGGVPTHHLEVVQCEGRLERIILTEVLNELLTQLTSSDKVSV